MFLNDSLHFLNAHVVIPNPLRINHDNRTALADAETVALGAVHAFRAFGEAEFLQSCLQMRVKRGRGLGSASRSGADKDMFSVRLKGWGGLLDHFFQGRFFYNPHVGRRMGRTVPVFVSMSQKVWKVQGFREAGVSPLPHCNRESRGKGGEGNAR